MQVGIEWTLLTFMHFSKDMKCSFSVSMMTSQIAEVAFPQVIWSSYYEEDLTCLKKIKDPLYLEMITHASPIYVHY